MIAFLQGKLKDILKDSIILNVNGVGYEVLMPVSWLDKHQKDLNKEFAIYIHTAAKDNDISLIGFPSLKEKIMFSRLLKVPSVGPKTALLVVSAYSASQIAKAVEDQNIEFFFKIKGVAKKTAQKIIIELRSQFKALKKEEEKSAKGDFKDLYEALQSMNFSNKEIKRMLTKIDKKLSIDKQIKQALKFLSK